MGRPVGHPEAVWPDLEGRGSIPIRNPSPLQRSLLRLAFGDSEKKGATSAPPQPWNEAVLFVSFGYNLCLR